MSGHREREESYPTTTVDQDRILEIRMIRTQLRANPNCPYLVGQEREDYEVELRSKIERLGILYWIGLRDFPPTFDAIKWLEGSDGNALAEDWIASLMQTHFREPNKIADAMTKAADASRDSAGRLAAVESAIAKLAVKGTGGRTRYESEAKYLKRLPPTEASIIEAWKKKLSETSSDEQAQHGWKAASYRVIGERYEQKQWQVRNIVAKWSKWKSRRDSETK